MRFIEPTCEYESQIRDYRQEFLDEGCSMDGTGALRLTIMKQAEKLFK